MATPLVVISTWLIAGRYADEMMKRRDVQVASQGKMLGLAALEYEQDHLNRLPSAKNWEQELKPYLGGITTSIPAPFGSRIGHRFAINSHIAGRTIGELEAPADAVLFYETTAPGPDASGPILPVPTNADGSTTVGIAYADGHVYTHPLDAWRIWWNEPDFRKKSLGELTKE